MKKQVGAIRRKIAKPGLCLCLQAIPRIFHGCALFLAVHCTKEGQSNLQKVPSHGVFLLEDMEENGETVFDTESIFLRILMVGQQRHLQLAPIFSYQLCAVPPTLADEFGCLRRGNKAALMNRLGIKLSWPRSPDIVIVDGQQLLYHVTWPCGGDPSVLVASMKARLASLPGECVLVFDHERMRHAVNYNLAINSPIPSRDAILKNKHNKRQLSRVLSTFDMGAAVIIDTQDTGRSDMKRRMSPSSATCCRQSVRERMWCVCFATILTCSCFLCSGCGGTSLWTRARCRLNAGMERYPTSTRRALN